MYIVLYTGIRNNVLLIGAKDWKSGLEEIERKPMPPVLRIGRNGPSFEFSARRSGFLGSVMPRNNLQGSHSYTVSPYSVLSSYYGG